MKEIQIVTKNGSITTSNPDELNAWLKRKGMEILGYFTEDGVYKFSDGSRYKRDRVWDWKIGAPMITKLTGPFRNGDGLRYESQAVYNSMSI